MNSAPAFALFLTLLIACSFTSNKLPVHAHNQCNTHTWKTTQHVPAAPFAMQINCDVIFIIIWHAAYAWLLPWALRHSLTPLLQLLMLLVCMCVCVCVGRKSAYGEHATCVHFVCLCYIDVILLFNKHTLIHFWFVPFTVSIYLLPLILIIIFLSIVSIC